LRSFVVSISCGSESMMQSVVLYCVNSKALQRVGIGLFFAIWRSSYAKG